MVVVQRLLETAEGAEMHRAQGRKFQLRVFDRIPLDVEQLIQEYEA
jgi:hypothetical protein